jgi:NAD(P)-dependent dehydrogenase (short-subunit alcohol dehydrogenase family)
VEIEGRIAVVTGAARGIGRATAVALARAGARGVGLADVDLAGLAETGAQVEKAGAAALVVPTDVARADALERLFRRVESDLGAFTLLHNNAGINGGEPAWPGTPVERIEAMLAVNLGGVILGTRLALPRMQQAGGGAIVNTASQAGHVPLPPDAVYAASKAGVEMFTRSCAPLRESHRVRVNCVCPGIVETPMLYETTARGELAAWLAPVYAAVEPLAPEEIADAVLALLRDESRAGCCVDVPNRPRASG